MMPIFLGLKMKVRYGINMLKTKSLTTFEEILQDLESSHELILLGKNDDEASNILYAFSSNSSRRKTHVLKELDKDVLETKSYTNFLPLFTAQFEVLQLPEIIGIYSLPEKDYLLLPYYYGDRFNFNTPDEDLPRGMVDVIKDLAKLDVESIMPGGSVYDFAGHEKEFWNFFEKAVTFGLIETSDVDQIRQKAEAILLKGRTTQTMIISNGDFNPRNIIRLSSGKHVLIDWNGIVSPLEHHLTYPWLLNFVNPTWQKQYASFFEKELPVNIFNTQYHLMKTSLERAVGEMGHYKPGINENPLIMVKDHMKNFYRGIEGFSSLSEV